MTISGPLKFEWKICDECQYTPAQAYEDMPQGGVINSTQEVDIEAWVQRVTPHRPDCSRLSKG